MIEFNTSMITKEEIMLIKNLLLIVLVSCLFVFGTANFAISFTYLKPVDLGISRNQIITSLEKNGAPGCEKRIYYYRWLENSLIKSSIEHILEKANQLKLHSNYLKRLSV